MKRGFAELTHPTSSEFATAPAQRGSPQQTLTSVIPRHGARAGNRRSPDCLPFPRSGIVSRRGEARECLHCCRRGGPGGIWRSGTFEERLRKLIRRREYGRAIAPLVTSNEGAYHVWDAVVDHVPFRVERWNYRPSPTSNPDGLSRMSPSLCSSLYKMLIYY